MNAGTELPGNRPEPPAQPMKLIAVVAGWATDFGATMLVSTVLGVVLAMVAGVQHAGGGIAPDSAQLETTVVALAHTLPMLLLSLVLGSMTTVLGGFVAAFIARRDEIWHALATGTLVLLTGLLFITAEHAMAGDQYPLWYIIVGLLLTFPCAMLGGWLCSLLRKKSLLPG